MYCRPIADQRPKGDTTTIKASVKEHTVYNGIKQTVIQRPKVVARGIAAGVPLSRWFPERPALKGALLSVATEVHTPELIELLAQSVKG